MKKLIINENVLREFSLTRELFNFENIRTYYEDFPTKGMIKILFKDYLSDGLTKISVESVVIGIDDIKNFSELQESIATPMFETIKGINL